MSHTSSILLYLYFPGSVLLEKSRVMDNPQHYQPLSHALHPPLATGPQYTNFPVESKEAEKTPEEEEEEEDNEEGIVEEQLDLQHPDSNLSSEKGDGVDGQEGKQKTGFVFIYYNR